MAPRRRHHNPSKIQNQMLEKMKSKRTGLVIKILMITAAMALLLLSEAQADRPRYFVVGEPNRTPDDPQTMQSYVVPIADQEQIEFARSIIGDETPPIMIVVAAIAPWSSPINRNYLLENAPAWSWSVISLVTFAEGVLTILDGRPSFVEANPDGWIKNTQGLIGFVGYTIIGELPIQPIYFLSDGWKRAFGALVVYKKRMLFCIFSCTNSVRQFILSAWLLKLLIVGTVEVKISLNLARRPTINSATAAMIVVNKAAKTPQ